MVKKKTRNRGGGHPCIAATNKALVEHNAQLVTAIQLDRDNMTLTPKMGIGVRKIDSKKRKPLPFFACTYCPICGERLEGE